MKFRVRVFVLSILSFCLIFTILLVERSLYEQPTRSSASWDSQDYVDPDPNNLDPNAQLAIREGHAREAEIERQKRARANNNYVNDSKNQEIISDLLKKYDVNFNYKLKEGQSPWKLAESWVRPRQIHPEYAPEIGEYSI